MKASITGPVYAIMSLQPGWVDMMSLLLDRGVRVFQLRAKAATDGEMLQAARRAVETASPRGAVVLVNDRFDIALMSGCDGVHLGDDDLPAAEVRRCWPEAIIGVTARRPSAARKAAADGADYLGVGPVFHSPTKPDLSPIGLDTLSAVASCTGLPVVAIGGITPGNVGSVIVAGAVAGAMVSGLADMLRETALEAEGGAG